jgi:hypothetical protein
MAPAVFGGRFVLLFGGILDLAAGIAHIGDGLLQIAGRRDGGANEPPEILRHLVEMERQRTGLIVRNRFDADAQVTVGHGSCRLAQVLYAARDRQVGAAESVGEGGQDDDDKGKDRVTLEAQFVLAGREQAVGLGRDGSREFDGGGNGLRPPLVVFGRWNIEIGGVEHLRGQRLLQRQRCASQHRQRVFQRIL